MDELDYTPDPPDDLAAGRVQSLASDQGVRTDSRAEPVHAELRAKPPRRADRESVVQNLSASLIGALRDGSRRVLVRKPVNLGVNDTARPDICVLRESEALSSNRKPQHDAIQLIVEVVNDVLEYQFDQLERYALAGVSEVWIIDLARHRVLVYQAPSRYSFAKRQLLVAPERMTLLEVPNIELKVGWIFAEL